MFQETISRKEKRLKKKRIFAITIFWLLSIFFGYWAIDLYYVTQLDSKEFISLANGWKSFACICPLVRAMVGYPVYSSGSADPQSYSLCNAPHINSLTG